MKRSLTAVFIICLLALTACGGKAQPAQPQPQPAAEPATEPAIDVKPEPVNEKSYWEEHILGDPLLQLVNKTHPLDEDYWPDDMVTVERHVEGVGNADTHKMREVAADALNEMFDAAEEEGIYLRMRTGFRSYKYQESLFASYAERNGEEAANRFSARAGQSEHQSGLCCDVGGKSEGYALSYKFGETPEGKWVKEHCAEYGFIIRYPEEAEWITGYVFEPWHIRYVGVEHAKAITEQGITLEEYLGAMR